MPLLWTSDMPQKQATANAAWTTFSTDPCSEMLVRVHSYHVMTTNVSCCRVCGSQVFSNPVTYSYCQESTITYFVQKIYIGSSMSSSLSRPTVMCQEPRKTCSTQVCYLQELISHSFQHYNYWTDFN